MTTGQPSPQFGVNVNPAADDIQDSFERTRIADEHRLDLIAVQDHPYNRNFLETWTLLSVLGARTAHVRLVTNVANIPLRPPAMLGKMAATLDVLTGGRVELGLGAGAYWQGIAAYGGPQRSPGESFNAFKDALHIIRGMLDRAGGSFTYAGEFYQVRGARPGPVPAHDIPLWIGALGPKMLHLTGELADGWLVSQSYVPTERLPEMNARIDEGAESAGRSPHAIRRGYNLMGAIDASGRVQVEAGIAGPVAQWVDEIVRFYRECQMDTFVFWPTAGDELQQVNIFAQEVVPAVQEALR